MGCWTSQAFHWLRVCAFPGWGTKIPHALGWQNFNASDTSCQDILQKRFSNFSSQAWNEKVVIFHTFSSVRY